jgi:hypothetical protein
MSTEITGRDANGKPREIRTDDVGRLVSAPSATWASATVTTSTGGGALGAVTNYGAGVLVKNTDASISVYLAPSLAELGAAATRYLLGPGESVVIPFASLAGIFVASASGAPLVSIIGAS